MQFLPQQDARQWPRTTSAVSDPSHALNQAHISDLLAATCRIPASRPLNENSRQSQTTEEGLSDA